MSKERAARSRPPSVRVGCQRLARCMGLRHHLQERNRPAILRYVTQIGYLTTCLKDLATVSVTGPGGLLNVEADELELCSEFGRVAVKLDWTGRGPRLRVRCLRSARCIYLDPLELSCLTLLQHEDLGVFLDPSQNGWRSDEGD